MKTNQSTHRTTDPRRPRVVGNYAKPPLTDQVPPAFETFPLTSYRVRMVNGRPVRNLPEPDVVRLREFDIENKK